MGRALRRLGLALWDSDPDRWPVMAIAGTLALVGLVVLSHLRGI